MLRTLKYLLLIICLGMCFEAHSQTVFCNKIKNETIIHKEYLTISYNTTYNIPNYVGEVLTINMTKGNIPRMSRFYSEPNYTKVTHNSYNKIGYDRGHMAPAADFKGCEQAMYESFSICNIAPQLPKLNRQYWEQLEEYVRKQLTYCDKMYIVTGTIVESPKYVNLITIPKAFYKAIIGVKAGKKIIGCAWVYNNTEKKQTVTSTKCTIDELENIIGLNLFPQLNKQNKTIESTILLK